jgi:WD40 repeat protein
VEKLPAITYSKSQDSYAQLWSIEKDQPPVLIKTLEVGRVGGFSPDGRLLATANISDTVSLWDAQTGQLQYELKDGGFEMVFSPDNQ